MACVSRLCPGHLLPLIAVTARVVPAPGRGGEGPRAASIHWKANEAEKTNFAGRVMNNAAPASNLSAFERLSARDGLLRGFAGLLRQLGIPLLAGGWEGTRGRGDTAASHPPRLAFTLCKWQAVL